MIPPTIGRVVLVYRGEDHEGGQWLPGLITFVHEESVVTVSGVDTHGDPWCEQAIDLRQDDIAQSAINIPPDLEDETPFACWMPYQRQTK